MKLNKFTITKIGMGLLAVVSSGAIAIGVSACSSNSGKYGIYSSWVSSYWNKFEKEMSNSTNPDLVITSTANTQSITNAFKAEAQSTLLSILKSDSKLSNDISISGVTLKSSPSKANKYIGTGIINFNFSDQKIKLPAKVMSATSKFNWKSTNNFFEWNNFDPVNVGILMAQTQDDPFYNLEISSAEATVGGVTKILNNIDRPKAIGKIVDMLIDQKVFVYSSTYKFLRNHLTFGNVTDVTVNNDYSVSVIHQTFGSFTMTLEPKNTSSPNVLKVTKIVDFAYKSQ